jgi:hypothetical protein
MGFRRSVGLLLAVFGVSCVLGAVGALALAVSSSPSAGPDAGSSSLAERINGACGRFELVDWSAGSEFAPLPPGVVQVTCSRGDGTLFYVAVAR